MNRQLRTLALPTALTAALVLTSGCGTQQDGGAAEAPITDTSAVTVEPAGTGTDTEPEAAEDPAEDRGEEAGEAAPEALDIPTIAQTASWTETGDLVDVYDDVAVFTRGEDVATIVVGRAADGTQVWQRPMVVPEDLAEATDVRAMAVKGHRTVRLAWTGTPAGSSTSLLVVAVVDPATGEDLATSTTEVPAGTYASEPASLDQLWLGNDVTPTGLLMVIDDDATTTVDDPYDDSDRKGTHRVTEDLWINHVDGTIQVVGADGPVGEGGTCAPMDEPGTLPFVPSVHADRSSTMLSGDLIDLVDGSVTCYEAVEGVDGWAASVRDDGLQALLALEGDYSDWDQMTGVALVRDGEVAISGPAGHEIVSFLGDGMILLRTAPSGSWEDGYVYAAHPLG